MESCSPTLGGNEDDLSRLYSSVALRCGPPQETGAMELCVTSAMPASW